ncbi:SDR family NAD(P)-dependent oxidoreductase [Nostoc sp. FACHB-133]|uniref:SDR family NAD(P)-dependent oxidoreductase n=1 Tax=Nostoc sp. FACHB-133 TaxID=2692835 RepID=UPI00168515C9|nr:SDR family NAD(P)-dependent oxidoreductase [Nostoc sp. FACHB-133]MBD2525415.1 SDR family NAD(P)-dependent oxidoreductase [Nostoc sp. FACHB-133]
MQTAQIIGKFTITDNDYFVREHRVDGIHIMPGVTFIDMIFKTLKARFFDIENLELRNIMFLEPIVTTADFDRKVEIHISPNGTDWGIEATSTKWKNGEVKDSSITKHLTCQLLTKELQIKNLIDISILKHKATQVVDLDACYAITRKVGIDHDNFMKPSGKVYGSLYGCLAEVSLGSIALQHSDDFLFHPVFLDCSTIVPLFYSIPYQATAQLYVPFYIESFSGRPLTGLSNCYVYVDHPEQLELTKEIGYRSFVICDEYGNQLATFHNFGIKKVHNIELIRRLANLEQKTENTIFTHQQQKAYQVLTTPEIRVKHVVESIKKIVCKYTEQNFTDDLLEVSFFELGLESTALLDISHELEKLLNIRLYPTMLFEQPTVSKLAEFLWREHSEAVQRYLHTQLNTVNDTLQKIVTTPEPSVEYLVHSIKKLVCQYTKQDFTDDLPEVSFFELGLESTALLDISHDLEKLLNIRLYPTTLFEQPTVSKLAEFLWREHSEAVQKYLHTQLNTEYNIVPTNLKHANLPPNKFTENGHSKTAKLDDLSFTTKESELIFIPKWQPTSISISNQQSFNYLKFDQTKPAKTLIVTWGENLQILQLLLNWHGSNNSYIITVGNFYQNWQNCTAQIRHDQPQDWDKLLKQLTDISQVYFLAIPQKPEQLLSHNYAFHFIKSIIRTGLTQHSIEFKIITLNAVQVFYDEEVQPDDSGLWGLWKSFSREYKHCTITFLDLAVSEIEDALRKENTIWLENTFKNECISGNAFAVRQQQIYCQRLYNLAPVFREGLSKFKPNGTYLIIGGIGGLGLVLSDYLHTQYSANIALLGRSPADDNLLAKISHLGKYGENVIYLQAHCDDVNELTNAITQTKDKFGKLDGIIHSAMVLDDSLLMKMSEADFTAVLQPKVAGAIALNQATLNEELDLIIFFSSLQSFVGNIGQSNYAAASTFLDSYAKYMQQTRNYPVCVINWGFWGEVGAVANDKYRDLMLHQGMDSINIAEGMEALETIIAMQIPQAVVVKAKRNILLQIGLDPHLMLEQRPITEILSNLATLTIDHADFFTANHPPLLKFKQGLDQLMAAAATRLVGILQNLGLFNHQAASYRITEAIKSAKIIDEHHHVFAEIFQFLVQADYLSQQNHYFSATAEIQYQGEYHTLAEFENAANQILQTQSELKQYYQLLHTCLKNYEDILLGKIAANNIVFPNSSLDLVEGVYSGNLASDIYNELVATALVNQIKAKFNGKSPEKIKVLEVGAGTGGTTRYVINSLVAHNIAVEYVYTDVWFKLLEHGREKFAKTYPGMRFSVLDISLNPEKQGWQEQFDFVIATNILHATPNIRESLRNVKQLLKPTGWLIFNESVKSQNFSTLTFGLLRGWWNSQDRDLRYPGSPLLQEATWQRLMREEGFFNLQSLVPTSSDKEDILVQQVFVARSDGQLLKVYSSQEVKVAITREHEIVNNTNKDVIHSSIREHLQPINLYNTYGCTRQKFACIDSYFDKNNCLWLFLNSANGNALSIEVLDELLDIIAALSKDKSSLNMPKIVYISHHGKYFSLGGDRTLILEYLKQQNPAILKKFAAKVQQVIHGFVSLNALVVAVINGAAQGGGLEMLLCSDFQFVDTNVKLGLPEVKSGLIPGMGGMSFLKQQIGLIQTKKLVLTGELINAQIAYEIGLISHISDDPFIEAFKFYKTIDNFDTAIYLKKFLDQGKSQALIQDIDFWVEYLIQKGEWVSQKRISASLRIVNS